MHGLRLWQILQMSWGGWKKDSQKVRKLWQTGIRNLQHGFIKNSLSFLIFELLVTRLGTFLIRIRYIRNLQKEGQKYKKPILLATKSLKDFSTSTNFVTASNQGLI